MTSRQKTSGNAVLRLALALTVVGSVCFVAWRVSARSAAGRNAAVLGTPAALSLASPMFDNPPGAVETAFDPNANNIVNAIAVQPDGKILIGGIFTVLNPNGSGSVTRNRIARLNADGTLDPAFDPNASSDVWAIAVQPDGKILIGGRFTTLNPNGTGSVTRNGIARLHPDGSLDTAFDPNITTITGSMGFVVSIAVQADGKILIGGFFNGLNPNGTGSVPRNGIARLHPDGTLDSAFNPNPNHNVFEIAVQADGKILIGGHFTSLNPNGTGEVTRNYLARLNADGTLDPAFAPNANGTVYALAVQADDKIIIGGAFTTLNPNGTGEVTRSYLARLNANGTLDSAFDPPIGGFVLDIAVQANSMILIGGEVSLSNPNGTGSASHGIARLHADGTLDPAFDPNANDRISTIAVQADGKILIGGFFNGLNPNGTGSVPRNYIARLYNDPATQSLTVPSTSTVQWLRGGTSPEAQHVTFELSTDSGTTWAPLGAGTRISGGWNLTGLSLPNSGQIRARAFIHTGGGNGGSGASLVETVTAFPCPTITATVSGSGTFCPGTSATVMVNLSGGSAPYTVTLSDGQSQTSRILPLLFTVTPTAATIYTVQTATDASGCAADVSGSASFTPETIAPNTALTSTPAAVSSAEVSFTFTGTDNCTVSSFECKLDGGGWAACSSGQRYTGLASGPHTFQVRALDAAGNRDASPASYSWEVFAASCGTVVNPATLPAATRGVPFVQTLSGSPTGSYTFSLLSGSLPPGVTLVNTLGIYSLRGTPTASGPYTFTIRARRNGSTCEGARTYTINVP